MKKEELYRIIDEKTKVISHPTTVHETVNIWASGFPKGLFDQWKQSCIESYNDIYWAKIWNDHIKSQAYDAIIRQAMKESIRSEPVQLEAGEKEIPLIGEGR